MERLKPERGLCPIDPYCREAGLTSNSSSTLELVVQRLFQSPQNRDKFQLPPQVEAIRVENSTLVMSIR
jgi:hypothetical protein